MIKYLTLTLFIILCASCQPAVRKGVPITKGETDAYVIVALHGNMPIREARYCVGICVAWYTFDSNRTNGVYIFKKKVGSTFEINTLLSGMMVVGFNGKKIKIEKPGIYYFGLINSKDNKLLYVPEPLPGILNQAKADYGKELENLQPIDFSWPVIKAKVIPESCPPFKYPDASMKDNEQGVTLVELNIDETGKATSAGVKKAAVMHDWMQKR